MFPFEFCLWVLLLSLGWGGMKQRLRLLYTLCTWYVLAKLKLVSCFTSTLHLVQKNTHPNIGEKCHKNCGLWATCTNVMSQNGQLGILVNVFFFWNGTKRMGDTDQPIDYAQLIIDYKLYSWFMQFLHEQLLIGKISTTKRRHTQEGKASASSSFPPQHCKQTSPMINSSSWTRIVRIYLNNMPCCKLCD